MPDIDYYNMEDLPNYLPPYQQDFYFRHMSLKPCRAINVEDYKYWCTIGGEANDRTSGPRDELTIKKDFVFIKAPSRQGLIHGLYSLVQLIPRSSGSNDSKMACITVKDYPHFKWRGMLLDCCRHFMEVGFIKRYIDLLAYHKMNVLHWHLTEDQGWRVEIDQYPKLNSIGSYRLDSTGKYGGYYSYNLKHRLYKSNIYLNY